MGVIKSMAERRKRRLIASHTADQVWRYLAESAGDVKYSALCKVVDEAVMMDVGEYNRALSKRVEKWMDERRGAEGLGGLIYE